MFKLFQQRYLGIIGLTSLICSTRLARLTILIGLILTSNIELSAKPADKNTSLGNLPTQMNQKAIENCFDKMLGIVTIQDANDLNSLRVTLERVYQLPKALLFARQLEFRKESGKKIVFEFNALQNSKPGAETYLGKSFSFTSNAKVEDSSSQSFKQALTRAQLDKFVTDDELIKDERSEEYKMLTSRSITVKSINFKVQEIESFDNRSKKRFSCSLFDGRQPLCQCN